MSLKARIKPLVRRVKKHVRAQFFHVVESPLDIQIPGVQEPSGLTMKVGDRDDWETLEVFLRRFYHNPREVERFRGWLAKSEERICFLGFVDDRLVYNSWVALTPYSDEHFGLEVPVRPGEAFAIAAFTDHEFRGRLMHRAIHRHLLLKCHARGLKRVRWLMAAGDYERGMTSYEKSGFTTYAVGRAIYLKLLWYRRFWLTGVDIVGRLVGNSDE